MYKLLLIIICFFTYNCYAVNCISKKYYSSKRCRTTCPSKTYCAPHKFPLTNNLTKADSGCGCNKGEKIIIKGKLLDQHCTPVSDANIYLWQSQDLIYDYKYEKNHLDVNTSFFKGAGSTKSNNKGEFYFITLKPKDPNKKPSINIRVEHNSLKSLNTKFIISQNNLMHDHIERKRCLDSILCKYPIYAFKIVMKGRTFKRY